MEKLSKCKTKATQLLFKDLPKMDYPDKELYSKYLRVRDVRKFVPTATGVLTGLCLMGWLSCGLGEWYFPAAVYGCAACFAVGAGFGTYFLALQSELSLKNKLLKETEQEK